MSTSKNSSARCSVCQHEHADKIDDDLRNGASHVATAEKHGLSSAAISRHAKNHLIRVVTPPPEPVSDAEEWRQQLRQLYGAACSVLKKANEAGDSATTLQAMRQAQSTISLIAKMRGLTGSGGNKSVVAAQILAGDPRGNELRRALFKALKPFPDARRAVARELFRIDAMGDPDDN